MRFLCPPPHMQHLRYSIILLLAAAFAAILAVASRGSCENCISIGKEKGGGASRHSEQRVPLSFPPLTFQRGEDHRKKLSRLGQSARASFAGYTSHYKSARNNCRESPMGSSWSAAAKGTMSESEESTSGATSTSSSSSCSSSLESDAAAAAGAAASLLSPVWEATVVETKTSSAVASSDLPEKRSSHLHACWSSHIERGVEEEEPEVQ